MRPKGWVEVGLLSCLHIQLWKISLIRRHLNRTLKNVRGQATWKCGGKAFLAVGTARTEALKQDEERMEGLLCTRRSERGGLSRLKNGQVLTKGNLWNPMLASSIDLFTWCSEAQRPVEKAWEHWHLDHRLESENCSTYLYFYPYFTGLALAADLTPGFSSNKAD